MAIYQKVVALNKDAHQQHKLKQVSDFYFASDMQTVPVVANEFREATKEYPIVFVRVQQGQEALVPMVLLGLQSAQNLFVGDDGAWSARYVPAFIRRYPFIFAETGTDQLTLCVDEEFAGFNTDEGTALFNDGEESDFLKEVLQFVSAYHRDSQLTTSFVNKLQSLDLLEEKNLKAELKDGREFVVQGFYVVDEDKLNKLNAEQVQGLFSTGELGVIYAHLMSLSNLNRLLDLATERGTQVVH